jgi:hypothetical protein
MGRSISVRSIAIAIVEKGVSCSFGVLAAAAGGGEGGVGGGGKGVMGYVEVVSRNGRGIRGGGTIEEGETITTATTTGPATQHHLTRYP